MNGSAWISDGACSGAGSLDGSGTTVARTLFGDDCPEKGGKNSTESRQLNNTKKGTWLVAGWFFAATQRSQGRIDVDWEYKSRMEGTILAIRHF